MQKLSRMLSSIAVAAVFLSASPASAQGTPAYTTTYYSDSSQQTVVGIIRWTGCNRWGQPVYRLAGAQTAYSVDELVGYCDGTSMEPAY